MGAYRQQLPTGTTRNLLFPTQDWTFRTSRTGRTGRTGDPQPRCHRKARPPARAPLSSVFPGLVCKAGRVRLRGVVAVHAVWPRRRATQDRDRALSSRSSLSLPSLFPRGPISPRAFAHTARPRSRTTGSTDRQTNGRTSVSPGPAEGAGGPAQRSLSCTSSPEGLPAAQGAAPAHIRPGAPAGIALPWGRPGRDGRRPRPSDSLRRASAEVPGGNSDFST